MYLGQEERKLTESRIFASLNCYKEDEYVCATIIIDIKHRQVCSLNGKMT